MRAVVVHDDMDRGFSWDLTVNVIEKFSKLDRAVASVCLIENAPNLNIECSK